MIAEAVDTVVTLGWALAVWIVLTAAAVTLALYAVAAIVWGAARAVADACAAVGARSRLYAPESDEQPSGATAAAAAERRTEPHTPAWARTDKDTA